MHLMPHSCDVQHTGDNISWPLLFFMETYMIAASAVVITTAFCMTKWCIEADSLVYYIIMYTDLVQDKCSLFIQRLIVA